MRKIKVIDMELERLLSTRPLEPLPMITHESMELSIFSRSIHNGTFNKCISKPTYTKGFFGWNLGFGKFIIGRDDVFASEVGKSFRKTRKNQSWGVWKPLNPGILDRNRHRWMGTDSCRSQWFQLGVVALGLHAPEGLCLVSTYALRFSQSQWDPRPRQWSWLLTQQ